MGRVLPFIILLLISCNTEKNDNVERIDYVFSDTKYVDYQEGWGWLIYAEEDNIFLQKIRSTSQSFNLSTGEVKEFGAIGEAPGEYGLQPVNIVYYKDTLFVGDPFNGKIILYDSNFNFVDERRNYFLTNSKIVIIDDSLIIGSRRSEEFAFIAYNKNIEKEIFKIGKPIDYPNNIDKSEVTNEGILYPNRKQWDAIDSLLMWYDSYNDKIRVYNIYKETLDTTFGIDHEGFNTPPLLYFEGDSYRPACWNVNAPQCQGLLISDKYIFVMLLNIWDINKEWRLRGLSEEEIKKIYTNDFIFIDVYTKNNYNYIGSFYPLNDYIYYEENKFLIHYLSIENDSTISIYMQEQYEGLKFLKISVTIKPT